MLPQEHVLLAPFTTMRTGGEARYFFVVQNENELGAAVAYAKKYDLPLLMLGGGSNMLISDQGFEGVVIKNEIKGVSYEDVGEKVLVTAGAGEVWDDLVAGTIERGLHGLENLSLIPGTVGAAPVQNINAYGAHVGDTIESVEVFDGTTMRTAILGNTECEFEYRASVFKKRKELFVTRVVFTLSRTGVVDYSYKDLEKYFGRKQITTPTLMQMRTAVVSTRMGKLPNVKMVGTAGSVFMHPSVSRGRAEELQKRFPDLLVVPYVGDTTKIIAGRLLDMLGWKGVRAGNVGTYQTHALAVVNYGSNNAKEVYDFAERMREDAKEKTDIDLEFEVNLVGNFRKENKK